MQDLSLYENVVTGDKELPVWLLENHIKQAGCFFQYHWHEHVEIHHIVKGECDIFCNQNKYHVVPGNLLIVNSNELHQGICTCPVLKDIVLIFDMDTFSQEIAGRHMLFQPLIQQDSLLNELFLSV